MQPVLRYGPWRGVSYGALAGALATLTTGCPDDPPSFVNLGTESATQGVSTGDSSTGTPAESSTGEESSTGPAESSSDGADSTTGMGSSSSDDNSMGSICGDGVITGVEDCDCGGGPCTPEGLGNAACTDAENPLVPGILTGGTLGCNPASCKFDVSLCTWCGDKELNGEETCEIAMPFDDTCASLGKGSAGDLFCNEKTCQLDTIGCTECGAVFDFDDCDEPFWFPLKAHGNAPDSSWECGVVSGNVPGAPPANGETVLATVLDATYNAQESSAIFSPPIDLTNCADGEMVELRVTHWWDFEGGIVNADGGIVQVSNDGFDWTTVTPVSGAMYNEDQVLTTAWNPPDAANGFSGNSLDEMEWVESAFDVSSFAGTDTLQVRFVFGSDNGTNRAGWYIDKVELVGSGKL